MHIKSLIATIILISLAPNLLAQTTQPISRIAFGSCAHQDQPQPVWQGVLSTKPELFIFVGDNIYGDTEDMNVMREKYAKLGAVPGFIGLQKQCPILATWDDHDFGTNDGGEEYPKKRESKREMLRFFNEPPDSDRWKHDGIYDAKTFGPVGKRVQVILLDTRWFRSPLTMRVREDGRGVLLPTTIPNATVLGEAQWKWLEEQLKQPAEVRVIASSIQFLTEGNRYEKWANFPEQRQRLLDMISKTNGCVIISGDLHAGEISKVHHGYDLYDVTSSGLNRKLKNRGEEINTNRVGDIYYENNFGLITIDWEQADPRIVLQIRNIDGGVVLTQEEVLSKLK